MGYHRTVFRLRLRPELVNTGHRYAIAGLVLLAAALAGLFVLLWFVITLAHRIRHRPGMGTRRSIGAWPGRPPTSPTSRAASPW